MDVISEMLFPANLVASTEKIKIKSQKKKAHNNKPRLNTQIYTGWMIFWCPTHSVKVLNALLYNTV